MRVTHDDVRVWVAIARSHLAPADERRKARKSLAAWHKRLESLTVSREVLKAMAADGAFTPDAGWTTSKGKSGSPRSLTSQAFRYLHALGLVACCPLGGPHDRLVWVTPLGLTALAMLGGITLE